MGNLPVFISGFRSGTTLLANLLGMHPALAAWFETRELCEILRWMHVLSGRETAAFEYGYCVPPKPAGFSAEAVISRVHANVTDTFAKISGAKASGKAAHERYPLGNDCLLYSREEVLAALQDWQKKVGEGNDYNSLNAGTGKLITRLASLQCQAAGKQNWVNKTPEIGRFACELRESIGPCKIIYLVRDGLQVAASGYSLGWADVETLAYNWKGLLERTRLAMQDHQEHYLELRFEDLVRQPVASLERVLQFCSTGKNAADEAKALVQHFEALMGQHAFDTGRLGDREGLNADQVECFMAQAGDLYEALGYPCGDF